MSEPQGIKPKVLYCFPDSAGKKFMPSNGTEGMIFMDSFCSVCINEKFLHTNNDSDLKCEILSKSMLEDDVEEWIFSDEGWPVCTKWKHWDWGNDKDDNGLTEPPPPEPYDPNQLVMPFMLDEILEQKEVFQENSQEELVN